MGEAYFQYVAEAVPYEAQPTDAQIEVVVEASADKMIDCLLVEVTMTRAMAMMRAMTTMATMMAVTTMTMTMTTMARAMTRAITMTMAMTMAMTYIYV